MVKTKLLAVIVAGLPSPAWAQNTAQMTSPITVLDDVIVTATRTEISSQDAPGSVTYISRKDIEKKGGENLLDILRGTQGVSLRGIGSGGRKAISLRGMGSKHTLILVDGKRIPASNDVIGPNTDYQYDWVSLSNIDHIEVVRGPMSVLYGSDALGGVINIITRKPDKSLSGDVTMTGRIADNSGSDGHDLDFNLSGSANSKLTYQVGARQSRRAAVDSKLKPGQSAIEGRDKQQFSLSLGWQASEKHAFTLDFTDGKEDRWFDTVKGRSPAITFYQSSYDIDRQQVSLGWKGKFGETEAALRAYQSEIDVVNYATNGVRPTSPQKLQDKVLEGNLNFPVRDHHFFTVGLEHRVEDLQHPKLPSGSNDFSRNAFYFQDEFELSDNTLLTLGARVDDHEAFGSETSPRASIVWHASDKLTFKGSYGYGFRAPTIKQVTQGYSFPISVFLITSNPDLKPEINNAYEVGVNYSSRKYKINAVAFDNKVKNLIDTRFDQSLPGGIQQWTFDNIEKAHLKGVEFSTEILASRNLTLNANYQYLDAKDGNGQALERRPRHTLSAGLTWEKRGWEFNLNAESLLDQLIAQRRTIKKVPNYTLWNLGVRKSVSKHIDISAGIENLTDVRLEDKSPVFRHEEYPRTLRLQVKVGF